MSVINKPINEMSLEELMEVRIDAVYSAAHHEQKVSKTISSISFNSGDIYNKAEVQLWGIKHKLLAVNYYIIEQSLNVCPDKARVS